MCVLKESDLSFQCHIHSVLSKFQRVKWLRDHVHCVGSWLVTLIDTMHHKVGALELAPSEAMASMSLPHARAASHSARRLIMR